MSGNLIRTVVATVAVAAMSLVGAGVATAAPAQAAAPAPAVSSTVDGYQMDVAGISYTFNHDQSVALYNAAKAGGVGAVSALCARFAGAVGAVACGVLAAFIVDTLTDPPASNECYQIYPRIGLPPVGARVVNC